MSPGMYTGLRNRDIDSRATQRALALPMTARCQFCDWVQTGTAEHVIVMAEAHRRIEHPDVVMWRRVGRNGVRYCTEFGCSRVARHQGLCDAHAGLGTERAGDE